MIEYRNLIPEMEKYSPSFSKTLSPIKLFQMTMQRSIMYSTLFSHIHFPLVVSIFDSLSMSACIRVNEMETMIHGQMPEASKSCQTPIRTPFIAIDSRIWSNMKENDSEKRGCITSSNYSWIGMAWSALDHAEDPFWSSPNSSTESSMFPRHISFIDLNLDIASP